MILGINLLFSAIMFFLSIVGILLNLDNFWGFLIHLQLMFLAINTNFITYARLWHDITGQTLVFFILIFNAIELVISLALFLKLFKTTNNITLND